MSRMRCVVLCALACSAPARTAVPAVNECGPRSLCNLASAATGLIEVYVEGIGSPVVLTYTERLSGTLFELPMTPVIVGNLSVRRGSFPATDTVWFDGRVAQDGGSDDGPVFGNMFLFTIDNSADLPPYALGCGGQFWAGDGGTRVSSYYPEGLTPPLFDRLVHDAWDNCR